MAIRKRKKSKAAHKRTKKRGTERRRLEVKLRREGLTKAELKRWNKGLDHDVRGLLR
jgi:arsenate reductase-like glutaredoxin family protein